MGAAFCMRKKQPAHQVCRLCRWRYAVLCFFDVVNKPFADLAGAVCFGAVGCDVRGYYSSIH